MEEVPNPAAMDVELSNETRSQFHQPAPKAEDAKAHRAPLIIEICAGTALLSECFKDAGFDHLAIDHSKNRFHPYVSICNVDLTKAHG